MFTPTTIAFIERWQQLIGAAAGPFFAIILSALAFWAKSKVEKRRARKEAHKNIAIMAARSLNDAFVLREQLLWFAKSLGEYATEARSITDKKTFYFSRQNSPALRRIYRNEDVGNFKVRSYYVHNKLLIIDAAVKANNEIVIALKDDLEALFRHNELQISYMKDNPNPPMQRESYAAGIDSYVDGLVKMSEGVNRGIETLLQLTVYNNLLRSRRGYLIWLHLEKWHTQDLTLLDTIDHLIQPKVDKEREVAEKRVVKIRTD